MFAHDARAEVDLSKSTDTLEDTQEDWIVKDYLFIVRVESIIVTIFSIKAISLFNVVHSATYNIIKNL